MENEMRRVEDAERLPAEKLEWDAQNEPLTIELGQGKIEIGQGRHGEARLPAILFGRNGAGKVGVETEGDRVMKPGECIAAITFENPESLDVVAEKLAELRARIWPTPPAAPAVDAAELTEDEKDSLLVKVKGYMQAVDLHRLLLLHEKCETEEAEIFAGINALIAKRVPNALTVDAAELGKLVALAEACIFPASWYPEGSLFYTGADGEMHPVPIQDRAVLSAATPAAILRIAALVAQQAARIAELEARNQHVEHRACNACTWRGKVEEAVMLGSIGPLCPECRETTEIVSWMKGLARYIQWSNGSACGMDISENGQWVAYDDVREFLATQEGK